MAKSPLVVDITAIKRKPGTSLAVVRRVDASDDFTLASAEVLATELELDLGLEFMGDDLVAAGTITIGWTGPCRRCLEDQAGTTEVAVREIFEPHPTEGETYRLDENEVDLSTMIREASLLNLPVAPLCSPDCAGPDPTRFPTTVEADPAQLAGEDPDPDPPGDPRWAALDELRFD